MIRTEAQRVSPEQVKESYSLMSKFAYLFWEGREVIKGDARMYNSPVFIPTPFCNGYPTLGSYIEWWETGEWSHFEKNGGLCLVYSFYGSPLSGTCYSSCSDIEARKQTFKTGEMLSHLKEFASARKKAEERYPESEYPPYSLSQVVTLLGYDESTVASRLLSERKSIEISRITLERDEWERKYFQLLTKPYKECLHAMAQSYCEIQSKIRSLQQEREFLYEEKKNRKINGEEYNAEVLSLARKISKLKYAADTNIFNVLHECFPELVDSRADARKLYPYIQKYL